MSWIEDKLKTYRNALIDPASQWVFNKAAEGTPLDQTPDEPPIDPSLVAGEKSVDLGDYLKNYQTKPSFFSQYSIYIIAGVLLLALVVGMVMKKKKV